MATRTQIDQSLETQLTYLTRQPCPPRLAAALKSAVFPGGGRVRPMLVLSVAEALGIDSRSPGGRLASAAASALEMLHCASLVHDDLPCFDDATCRRGRRTVHVVYGDSMAVLAGDALIVGAFQCLLRVGRDSTGVTAAHQLLVELGEAAGAPAGIVAGQAFEAEPSVDLVLYHEAKTASMFEAAVAMGALAAGADPESWRPVGRLLGLAYQFADDLADLQGEQFELGKPTGQDERGDRPNAARHLGISGASLHLRRTLAAAAQAVPDCGGRDSVVALVRGIGMRLLPATPEPSEVEYHPDA